MPEWSGYTDEDSETAGSMTHKESGFIQVDWGRRKHQFLYAFVRERSIHDTDTWCWPHVPVRYLHRKLSRQIVSKIRRTFGSMDPCMMQNGLKRWTGQCVCTDCVCLSYWKSPLSVCRFSMKWGVNFLTTVSLFSWSMQANQKWGSALQSEQNRPGEMCRRKWLGTCPYTVCLKVTILVGVDSALCLVARDVMIAWLVCNSIALNSA
jgi:hypothetical protein